jgi:hypothetical protein
MPHTGAGHDFIEYSLTRGSAALRTLVTWVVLIASRDGFFNPLKPNSQDYTISGGGGGLNLSTPFLMDNFFQKKKIKFGNR